MIEPFRTPTLLICMGCLVASVIEVVNDRIMVQFNIKPNCQTCSYITLFIVFSFIGLLFYGGAFNQ